MRTSQRNTAAIATTLMLVVAFTATVAVAQTCEFATGHQAEDWFRDTPGTTHQIGDTITVPPECQGIDADVIVTLSNNESYHDGNDLLVISATTVGFADVESEGSAAVRTGVITLGEAISMAIVLGDGDGRPQQIFSAGVSLSVAAQPPPTTTTTTQPPTTTTTQPPITTTTQPTTTTTTAPPETTTTTQPATTTTTTPDTTTTTEPPPPTTTPESTTTTGPATTSTSSVIITTNTTPPTLPDTGPDAFGVLDNTTGQAAIGLMSIVVGFGLLALGRKGDTSSALGE